MADFGHTHQAFRLKAELRTRISFFALFVGGLLPAAAAEKLNVLLIISDDLRDTVGCYGNPAVKTPNIDRLAQRGVRFERAYVQYPVCNASRTSFLTGLRAEQTGVVNNATNFRTRLPDIVTLPQKLRQEGWHAAAYGKHYDDGNCIHEFPRTHLFNTLYTPCISAVFSDFTV